MMSIKVVAFILNFDIFNIICVDYLSLKITLISNLTLYLMISYNL